MSLLKLALLPKFGVIKEDIDDDKPYNLPDEIGPLPISPKFGVIEK